MTLYWFETRFDKKLSPYPSQKLSGVNGANGAARSKPDEQQPVSQTEIVENIIKTNIDPTTLNKIEQFISIPLKTLITPRVSNRRKTCNNIPRPQNNFVLYRRNLHAIIAKEQGSATAKNFKLVSNLAAKKWADESNEIKQLFEIIADCAKKVHDSTYPEYVYQPRINGKNNMKFRPMNMDERVFDDNSRGGGGGGGAKPREPKSVVPSLLLSTFSLSESSNNARTVPKSITIPASPVLRPIACAPPVTRASTSAVTRFATSSATSAKNAVTSAVTKNAVPNVVTNEKQKQTSEIEKEIKESKSQEVEESRTENNDMAIDDPVEVMTTDDPIGVIEVDEEEEEEEEEFLEAAEISITSNSMLYTYDKHMLSLFKICN